MLHRDAENFIISHMKSISYIRFVYLVESTQMARETGGQSKIELFQRLKNGTWYILIQQSAI